MRRQRSNTSDRLQNNSAFSYRSRRSEETLNLGRQTERTKEVFLKSTNYWLQRFGLVVLLIAALASIVSIVGLSATPKIIPIDSYSKSMLSHSDITNISSFSNKFLSSSIWNNNKITFDTNGLNSHLLNKFPQLDSVNVTIPLIARRPIVYVGLAQPAIIIVESSGSFTLDANGRAMVKESNPKELNLINVPVVTDQSGLSIKKGNQVLPTSFISFIQTVVAQLEAKNIHVSTLTLPAGASELDVGLAGQAYFVKFNLANNDPRNQAGTYLATIAQLQSQNITPSKYIDVRVDGRAYYQ